MAYVEWLRVKKTLIVLGIVLATLFLVAVVVRVSVNGKMNADTWTKVTDSSDRVSTRTLPDGGVETTIVAKGGSESTTVITDHGWNGKHIKITDPQGRFHRSDRIPPKFNLGPVLVHRDGDTTIEIDTNGPLDVGMLFGWSVLIGLIIATCLGAPLARENDRLEVAWTKPIDRIAYALQLYGVDVVGILAALTLSVICAIAMYSLFQAPHLTITAAGALKMGISIAAGIAWYAMFSALTSWMKRGHGAFLGIAWPVGLFVPGLALIPLEFNPVGQAFHWVFKTISYIDPLAYLRLEFNDHGHALGLASLDDPIKLGILVLLALVYAGAGLIEWRRVEA